MNKQNISFLNGFNFSIRFGSIYVISYIVVSLVLLRTMNLIGLNQDLVLAIVFSIITAFVPMRMGSLVLQQYKLKKVAFFMTMVLCTICSLALFVGLFTEFSKYF